MYMSGFDEVNMRFHEKNQAITITLLSLIPFPAIGKVFPWENKSIDFSLLFRSRSRRSMNIQKQSPGGVLQKGVLKNYLKFTGKHLCQNLFFNKAAGLRPATLFKKRLWHRCLSMNFEIFLRPLFFTEHFWWLLNIIQAAAL